MIPAWLKKMVAESKKKEHAACSSAVRELLRAESLHTVCMEAKCPNKGECFSKGEATFMILGARCTRGCKFCAVSREHPLEPDAHEPARIADSVRALGLRYVVLTSPTRDDMPDGGAAHYAAVINAVRHLNPDIKIEPLVPDFQGNAAALQAVLSARPDVLAHNIETVPSLYKEVRAGADYRRSLNLLASAKKISPKTLTKSGLMLGLGETKTELKQTIKDLRSHGVDLLTLGQYLAPSKAHLPVKNYPEPAQYDELKAYALNLGFGGVAAGPLVRSSYKAFELYTKSTII